MFINRTKQFFQLINDSQTMMLATASGASVTMRVISPVVYQNKILFFTFPKSVKYLQLKENPHCAIGIGNTFAEATAEFCGSTMLDANAELRETYCKKFPGAFDEGVAFGGRDAEFILLTPTRLKGWAFENDLPTADGIPTVPYEIKIAKRG